MIKLFLLLAILFPIKVLATNEYSYEVLEPTKGMEVIEDKLYKYYEEEIIYTEDYYEEGKNPSDYPYQSDIITSKITTNSLIKPEELPNRNINIKKINGYYHLKKIKEISIRDIIISNNRNLSLTEIEIYNKDKKINYNYVCFECEGFSPKVFNNNKFDDGNTYIKYQSIINIYLEEEIYPEDIKIVFHFHDNSSFSISFNIYYYDEILEDDLFVYNARYPKYDYIVNNISLKSNDFITFENSYWSTNAVFSKDDIINYKWDTNNISLNNDDNYVMKEVLDITVYDYEDILFKYYKINKRYLKDYYLNMPSYIKDETDYIIGYKYKKIENTNKEKTCEHINASQNNKKEEQNNEKIVSYNVIEKNSSASKLFKFRHWLVVIIISILGLMIYAVISLIKRD